MFCISFFQLRCAIAYTVPEMYGEYVMDGRSSIYRLEFLVYEYSVSLEFFVLLEK